MELKALDGRGVGKSKENLANKSVIHQRSALDSTAWNIGMHMHRVVCYEEMIVICRYVIH